MNILLNVLEAAFLFYVSWQSIVFYKGWGALSAQKEKRRQVVVESYGWLVVLLGGIAFFCGIGILIMMLE